jgi:predicted phosphohydrolase
MKVLCFSDTHCKHGGLGYPEADLYIFAGDASNSKIPAINAHELNNFLTWYASLEGVKVFVAGNHETSMEAGLVNPKDYPSIVFLKHELASVSVNYLIDGDLPAARFVRIFGSPYTPTYGSGWAYNVQRHKIQKYWEQVPIDLDFLVTHGPPKSIRDTTTHRVHNGCLEAVGDKSLLNAVLERKPKYHVFGHLHDEGLILNAGISTFPNIDTTFINASCTSLRGHELLHGGTTLNL